MSVVHIVIAEIVGYVSIAQERTMQQMPRTVSADISPRNIPVGYAINFVCYYIISDCR